MLNLTLEHSDLVSLWGARLVTRSISSLVRPVVYAEIFAPQPRREDAWPSARDLDDREGVR